MSAIVSEMDGGWIEIVWVEERWRMRVIFYFFFISIWEVESCGGRLSNVELTWPGKVEKCELDVDPGRTEPPEITNGRTEMGKSFLSSD